MRVLSCCGPRGVVEHVVYYAGLMLLLTPSFVHHGAVHTAMTAVDVAVVVGVTVALLARNRRGGGR